jgi:hypothetical protein
MLILVHNASLQHRIHMRLKFLKNYSSYKQLEHDIKYKSHYDL